MQLYIHIYLLVTDEMKYRFLGIKFKSQGTAKFHSPYIALPNACNNQII